MRGYLISPMSTTYSPTPIIGGMATRKANSQITCTYLDVKNVTCVTKCQERSCCSTDLHRIAAIAVMVYNELIPK